MERRRILVPLSYAAIYLIWGSTYYFIKIAVTTLPVPLVMAGRFTIGGLMLLLLAALTSDGLRRPSGREVLGSFFIGACLLLGGNGLVSLAEKTVDSYLAALIIANVPLVVALYNFLFFRTRLSFIRLIGIATGITGIGLLLYDGRSPWSGLAEPGVILIFAAIILWGLGTSLAPRLAKPRNPFLNTALQMFLAAAVTGVILLVRPPGEIEPSPPSLLASLYLAVIGTLAIAAYNYLLQNESTIRIVSYSLVNPVIATALGLLAGGETVRPLLTAGLPLILLGLVGMIYGDVLVKAARKRRLR